MYCYNLCRLLSWFMFFCFVCLLPSLDFGCCSLSFSTCRCSFVVSVAEKLSSSYRFLFSFFTFHTAARWLLSATCNDTSWTFPPLQPHTFPPSSKHRVFTKVDVTANSSSSKRRSTAFYFFSLYVSASFFFLLTCTASTASSVTSFIFPSECWYTIFTNHFSVNCVYVTQGQSQIMLLSYYYFLINPFFLFYCITCLLKHHVFRPLWRSVVVFFLIGKIVMIYNCNNLKDVPLEVLGRSSDWVCVSASLDSFVARVLVFSLLIW